MPNDLLNVLNDFVGVLNDMKELQADLVRRVQSLEQEMREVHALLPQSPDTQQQ